MNKRASLSVFTFSVAFLSLLTLTTCSELWGVMDDPSDPDSPSYQGYPTVGSVNDLAVVSPSSGGTLTGTKHTVTKVLGATAYAVRIAASEANLGVSNLYEKSDYTTNVLDISAAPIFDSTTYYWQARANKEGTWGDWTVAVSFTTDFSTPAATPTFSPPDGTYTSDQSVTISCSTSGATIYYTTDGSDPTTSSSQYTVPITSSVSGIGTTIKAKATAPFYADSEVASATYRVYAVGDTGPAGGIVFYDKGSFSDGWRWLEAATSDQSTGTQWWYGSSLTTGATATGTGSGEANTATIVTVQGAGTYAASICANLSLGGYDDWFLPSKDELNLMYGQKGVIGSFASDYYWSSSEVDNYGAWGQGFASGGQYDYYKGSGIRVRAVRTF